MEVSDNSSSYNNRVLGRILLFLIVGFFSVGLLLFYIFRASRAAPQVVTVKSGNWSDPSVWSGGAVPADGTSVGISGSHTVTYDLANKIVGGLSVLPGGTLIFKSDSTVLLQSTKNVIVEGNLVMKPSSSSINHTLRFVGVNESSFVGGGLDPLDSDVGLWVMGDGALDIQGFIKTTWLNAQGALSPGTTSSSLDKEPTGWQVDDEIVIVPTKLETSIPVPGSQPGFEERKLSAVNPGGKSINWNQGLIDEHPVVTFEGKTHTAEIINLTRNVHIEGQSTGRAHIFIRSSKPQTIKHASLRFLGPLVDGDGGKGRYSLHFHHNMDGSRGSIVEGVIVRDGTNQGFVPHVSNGIVMRNSAVYHNLGEGFWWDLIDADCTDPSSHDITWDNNIVANLWRTTDHDGFNRLGGFVLGRGNGNSVTNSVAVGVHGGANSSGFEWPQTPECPKEVGHIDLPLAGNWIFHDNLAHNNIANGIFVWQNDNIPHFVEKFRAYHNGQSAIEHGAYGNIYRYTNSLFFKNGAAKKSDKSRSTQIINHVASDIQFPSKTGAGSGQRLTYDSLVVDGGGEADYGLILSGHPNGGDIEAQFQNLTIKNFKLKAILIDEACSEQAREDFVNVTVNGADLEPSDFALNTDKCGRGMTAESIIRVQRRNNTAYKITPNSTGTALVITDIPAFAIALPPPPDTSPIPTQPTQGPPTNTPTPTPSPTISPTRIPTTTGSVTQSPPTITQPPTATQPPTGDNVNLVATLKLSFQGITRKTPTDRMNVKLTLIGGGGRYEKTQEFTVDDTGIWSATTTFQNVAKRSDYHILVKGPKHIQKRICVSSPQETVPGTYSCFLGQISIQTPALTLDLSKIKLLAGDLPTQDGVVDSYDLSLVRNILFKPLSERTSQANLELADINLDGVVDSQDFSLVIAALSIRSDEK